MSYYTYILTSKKNGTLYVGMTNDLIRRVYEHKNKIHEKSFSARYNVVRLIYFEVLDSPEAAIVREKQLKNLVRRKKISLIEQDNPEWRDLYDEISS
ncbi:MAG TPA: GIY-YIG nuclease family protein [Thermodesulfobacteriota bacterium]|nr:GIY-YIG nuclease family protein [Thermodesulfobacteriota bacterium]